MTVTVDLALAVPVVLLLGKMKLGLRGIRGGISLEVTTAGQCYIFHNTRISFFRPTSMVPENILELLRLYLGISRSFKEF